MSSYLCLCLLWSSALAHWFHEPEHFIAVSGRTTGKGLVKIHQDVTSILQTQHRGWMWGHTDACTDRWQEDDVFVLCSIRTCKHMSLLISVITGKDECMLQRNWKRKTSRICWAYIVFEFAPYKWIKIIIITSNAKSCCPQSATVSNSW